MHALESSSGRSALHKAAYWGHEQLTQVLLKDYKLDANVQDNDGDSALHDAARFITTPPPPRHRPRPRPRPRPRRP